MIKFGMSLPAIFNQLRKGYIKVRGTEPKGLDLIKIKQEAMQKFEDMRKVLDMQGNPIDPSKPIMGGTQMGQKGIFDNIFNRMQSQMGKKPKVIDEDTGKGFIDFVREQGDIEGAVKLQKVEDEIRAAIEAGNKRAAKKLRDKKKKKDDPEEKAYGGRIGLKDGMDRRKFMKIMGGLATLPVIGKFAKGVKLAAPAVTKAAELTGPALAKIVETVMDFGKLVSVKGRRVKEMVTKKKYKDIEVEEDVGDGSYIIKKGDKEIYYKPGRQDETGGFDDDIIEILEDRIKKAGGGLSYMLGE